MSQYDPNMPPPVETLTEPVYVETVVVRPDSNGLWIAAALAGGVIIVALWMFASRGGADADAELRLAQARADRAQAIAIQSAAQADIVQAQQAVSVTRARTEAIRAQASTPPVAPRTIILRDTRTSDAAVVARPPSSSTVR